MLAQPLKFPKSEILKNLADELVGVLTEGYQATRPFPDRPVALQGIPEAGQGAAALPDLWRQILAGSTKLAAPNMSGHMDTAPHPFAIMTQTLVSSLNNNMLFRELSPFASTVEEHLIEDFARRLNLGADWAGTWASGGSIANLTALFCAVGGYTDEVDRQSVHLLFPESGHASLKKAAAILGLPMRQLHAVACDDAGRLDTDALGKVLSDLPSKSRPVVVSVLGTTIHGSLDDIPTIADICQQFGAWHHVDAVYGGALMFSGMDWPQMAGLHHADSIAVGPQKWMYVPRVSAAVLVKGQAQFDKRMGVAMPYSLSGETHRGFWGIQGSRPADALVLWALLQALGTDELGAAIDRNIQMTRRFHNILSESRFVEPTHVPDLNLQVIRPTCDRSAEEIQQRLAEAGGFWTSLSAWRGQSYLRSVLLSPALKENHLHEFTQSLEKAAQ